MGGLVWLARGRGARQTRSDELVGRVMFQPDYLQKLVDVSRADAERGRDERLAFTGPDRWAMATGFKSSSRGHGGLDSTIWRYSTVGLLQGCNWI